MSQPPAKPNPELDVSDHQPPSTNTILHRLAEANAAAARSASSVVTRAPGPVSIAASAASSSSSGPAPPSRSSSTMGTAGSSVGAHSSSLHSAAAESPEEEDDSQEEDGVPRHEPVRRVFLRREDSDEGVVESSAGGVEGERRVSILAEEHQVSFSQSFIRATPKWVVCPPHPGGLSVVVEGGRWFSCDEVATKRPRGEMLRK